jgi:hypothetical protein
MMDPTDSINSVNNGCLPRIRADSITQFLQIKIQHFPSGKTYKKRTKRERGREERRMEYKDKEEFNLVVGQVFRGIGRGSSKWNIGGRRGWRAEWLRGAEGKPPISRRTEQRAEVHHVQNPRRRNGEGA